MANVKVRILYPLAFESMGIATWRKDKDGNDLEQLEETTVEQAQADTLVASGYAELVKSKAAK